MNKNTASTNPLNIETSNADKLDLAIDMLEQRMELGFFDIIVNTVNSIFNGSGSYCQPLYNKWNSYEFEGTGVYCQYSTGY